MTGLSKALQKKGHLVEIVLPKYDCMHYELIRDLKVFDILWMCCTVLPQFFLTRCFMLCRFWMCLLSRILMVICSKTKSGLALSKVYYYIFPVINTFHFFYDLESNTPLAANCTI